MVDLRVVSERSEVELRKAAAVEGLAHPTRVLAANVMRVVRGAGAPHELAGQMNDCLKAVIAYREAFGHYPDTWTFANILKMESESAATVEKLGHDSPDVQRWYEDGTFDRMDAIDTICKGALQILASRLLEQRTQEASGERELYEGIRALEQVREKSRQRRRPEAIQAPTKKRRPERSPKK